MRWLWLWVLVVVAGGVHGGQVTYDGRSLIINGNRSILFSGSIHYPRSTPQMWPSLIAKAKQGGIDVIDTYVFWNAHEPHPGQYNFKGRHDLVKFLQVIQAQGLYACLRIGPFIESEWSYGGLPFWLRDVPGIVFRSDNEAFKSQMESFVAKIVNLLKTQNLYASQGGPIILSQIENEYQNVEAAFHDKGPPYVNWAAKMAVRLQTGVPWVMCKQKDAPDPVINSCNGLNCGETFEGPNSPDKPSLWTENWTQRYEVFGEDAQGRSPEDLAFAVALFIAKKGSFVNYYMYHGGTNFGRWGSEYVKTSYYDQAPIDEYGMVRQPKWGHLKELHAAIKSCSATLLYGKPSEISLGQEQVAYVFQGTSGQCVAFLVNNDLRNTAVVNFHQTSYQLLPRSISILPDCKNVVFNTAKVGVQYNTRSSRSSQKLNLAGKWKEFKEVVPSFGSMSLTSNRLLEQMSTTEDKTDYLWYTFSYMHKPNAGAQLILHVESRSHVLHAFVNGELAGRGHGSHGMQSFILRSPISLKNGQNNISLLSVMVGLPDSGAYMERKVSGLRKVRFEGITLVQDFTNYQWGYQVGFPGEEMKIYKLKGSRNVNWNSGLGSKQQPFVWYKTNFASPEGNDPIALNLGSMSKGEAWVNGNSIGRYWVSFHTSQGVPSQTLYHVPRAFLKPTGNLLVIFEEMGGDPSQISLELLSVTNVRGHVSDLHPQFVVSNDNQLKGRLDAPHVQLQCPSGKAISAVEFASFGTPTGTCGNYTQGEYHAAYTRQVVEKACLGKESCSITLSTNTFGEDPCPGTPKALLVDANCG